MMLMMAQPEPCNLHSAPPENPRSGDAKQENGITMTPVKTNGPSTRKEAVIH